jgi:hypothetical protein
VQASPFAAISGSKDVMQSRRWHLPTPPENGIDKSNEMTGEELIAAYSFNHTSNLNTRASGCSQGECPDFDSPFHPDAAFDVIFQFTVIPTPGPPPIPIFTQELHLRVNECKECRRIKVKTENGCYNFKNCAGDQTICLDPDNHRAHRIYHKANTKNCVKIIEEGKGSCGFVEGEGKLLVLKLLLFC